MHFFFNFRKNGFVCFYLYSPTIFLYHCFFSWSTMINLYFFVVFMMLFWCLFLLKMKVTVGTICGYLTTDRFWKVMIGLVWWGARTTPDTTYLPMLYVHFFITLRTEPRIYRHRICNFYNLILTTQNINILHRIKQQN